MAAQFDRAKLLAFSDSIRDMESLGRDFNEPEERLGLQSAIVQALERAGGALTLGELHRRIVAWQESGPTFATTVLDTYWGRRLVANELIPGQYRAVPALPRHGIADVRLLDDPSTLSEEAADLLADGEFDVLISDIALGEKDGLDVLAQSRRLHPETPVILITASPDVKTAAAAVRPSSR